MGILERFEKKVEGAVSAVFARTFKGDVQPVEITARLQRELDAEAKLMSRDKRLVPNQFSVLPRPDRPRQARAVRQDAQHRDRRRAAQARPGDGLRLQRPDQDRVRAGQRPADRSLHRQLRGGRRHHRAQRPGRRHHHPAGRAGAGGQRHPAPAAAARPGHRPRQRRRPADQRPRDLAQPCPDSGIRQRRHPSDRYRRPRLDQRHRCQRAEGAARRPGGGITDRDRVDPDARPRSRPGDSARCPRSPSPSSRCSSWPCSGSSSPRRSR